MKVIGFSLYQVLLWLTAVTLFAVHQLIERYYHIHSVMVDNYMDAILFPIIVIPIILSDVRIRLKDYNYKFPLVAVIGITIALALVSELLFPYLSDKFVFDKYDILSIVIGGLFYFVIFNLPEHTDKNPLV